MTPEELEASWEGFGGSDGVSVQAEAPKPSKGRLRLVWIEALTVAASRGEIDPGLVGYALIFSRGGFDYATGIQTQPKTPTYLAESGSASPSTWKRVIKALVDTGWLTEYDRVSLGPRPTPLYRLTIPMGQP